MLPNGQLVAIKRARQGSMQGSVEFKTEIELLSRVHHKNLVGLVGFCFEQEEQMLVYEFVANGTLRDCLSGTSTASTLMFYSVYLFLFHLFLGYNHQCRKEWNIPGLEEETPGRTGLS